MLFFPLITVKMPTFVGILKFMSLLITVKMPAIVGILIFMSRKKFMLSGVEHETEQFYNIGAWLLKACLA